MPWKLNPFTSNLDYYENNFRGVLAAAPSSPANGWAYINSGDNGYYLYYNSTWTKLHTLTTSAVEFILLETGDGLLLETGDQLNKE